MLLQVKFWLRHEEGIDNAGPPMFIFPCLIRTAIRSHPSATARPSPTTAWLSKPLSLRADEYDGVSPAFPRPSDR